MKVVRLLISSRLLDIEVMRCEGGVLTLSNQVLGCLRPSRLRDGPFAHALVIARLWGVSRFAVIEKSLYEVHVLQSAPPSAHLGQPSPA